MFANGAAICLGIALIFGRCSWKVRMWILSHALFMDIVVFILLTLIHWGTFSGVMAATIGALMCSLLISIGRKLWGSMQNGKYMRGMYDVSEKLEAEQRARGIERVQRKANAK